MNLEPGMYVTTPWLGRFYRRRLGYHAEWVIVSVRKNPRTRSGISVRLDRPPPYIALKSRLVVDASHCVPVVHEMPRSAQPIQPRIYPDRTSWLVPEET